jgi:hypothetical protein
LPLRGRKVIFQKALRGELDIYFQRYCSKNSCLQGSFRVIGAFDELFAIVAGLNFIIFLATSSIDFLMNGGEEVFIARIFLYRENGLITFAANGQVFFNMAKWGL